MPKIERNHVKFKENESIQRSWIEKDEKNLLYFSRLLTSDITRLCLLYRSRILEIQASCKTMWKRE